MPLCRENAVLIFTGLEIWLSVRYGCQWDMAVSKSTKEESKIVRYRQEQALHHRNRDCCQWDMAVSGVWLSNMTARCGCCRPRFAARLTARFAARLTARFAARLKARLRARLTARLRARLLAVPLWQENGLLISGDMTGLEIRPPARYGCQWDMAVSEIWLLARVRKSEEKKSQKLCVTAKTGLLTTETVTVVRGIWLSARYGCQRDMAVSEIWLWACSPTSLLDAIWLIWEKRFGYGCQRDMAVSVIWLLARVHIRVKNCALPPRPGCCYTKLESVTAVSEILARLDMAVYMATIWLSLCHMRHVHPVRPEDHHGPVWIVDAIVLQ